MKNEQVLILDLIDSLETVKENLSNDIIALGYIQQSYFIKEPTTDFLLCYIELENKIETLFKSMSYNLKNLTKDLENINRELKEL